MCQAAANLRKGAVEIAAAMKAQAETLPYVYRNHFSSPVAEALAVRFCQLTEEPMGGAYFTNSGSEAVEAAVKLARVYHLAAGSKSRYKIISRWQSYHGITLGADEMVSILDKSLSEVERQFDG